MPFALICSIGVGMCIYEQQKMKENLELAKTNYEQYEIEKRKEDERHREQLRQSYEEHNIKEAINHPICPMCGGRNTMKISTASRATSVALVGLASSKIGKQYQCKTCGYKW